MATNQFSYLELPTENASAMKAFYKRAFGWTHQDWGPDYVTAHGSGLETGYNGSVDGRSRAPLPMIETDDIAAAEAQVRAAGGKITLATFAYPGGRRFHFADPSGNELAVMQPGA